MDREEAGLKMVQIVSKVMGVDVKKKTNKSVYVEARAICSKLLLEQKYTRTDAGVFLGKNHAMIIQYLKIFDSRIKTNVRLYEQYLKCNRIFEGEEPLDQNISSQIKLLVQKQREYDNYVRLEKIIKLISERTPKGQEDFVEMKINRMFNGLTYDRR